MRDGKSIALDKGKMLSIKKERLQQNSKAFTKSSKMPSGTAQNHDQKAKSADSQRIHGCTPGTESKNTIKD